ncbi:hypothetical protein, partial [Pseudoclavibacter helvolus]|uniref:hypothetical protein n=1 Tax=Pseudoclavibacter helvolus TaxID=255205 RepID=UPI001AC004A9
PTPAPCFPLLGVEGGLVVVKTPWKQPQVHFRRVSATTRRGTNARGNAANEKTRLPERQPGFDL